MKTKLQALIAEQKALTAKIEKMINAIEYCEFKPEVLSTTEESSTLDPKKVYIKGHPTRGAEVIKMLEDLGGVNTYDMDVESESLYYGIDIYSNIVAYSHPPFDTLPHTELHLPEEVSEVDPPKEEVELIEGEVYYARDFVFIYTGQDYDGACIYLCGLNCDSIESKLSNNGSFIDKEYNELATPEQRKQLFDALEKAGKHFDKENMRLLDVEEWSCEKGLPIMVRNETSNWRVDIFHSYDVVDVKYPFLCAICKDEDRPYKYAIPYNDQTKHLIGTTDSPDKHYKFVEL